MPIFLIYQLYIVSSDSKHERYGFSHLTTPSLFFYLLSIHFLILYLGGLNQSFVFTFLMFLVLYPKTLPNPNSLFSSGSLYNTELDILGYDAF